MERYPLLSNRNNTIEDEANDIKLCVIFGPKVPKVQFKGIVLFLLVVALQRFFYFNSLPIFKHVLFTTFSYKQNDYIFSMLVFTGAPFVPIIGLVADSWKINRSIMLSISLFLMLLSSLILTVLLFLDLHFSIIQHGENYVLLIVKVIIVFSFALFVIGITVFFSFVYPYGLNILEGAPLSALLLNFSLVYIAMNIGSLFKFLQYYKVDPAHFSYYNSANSAIILLACLIFLIGALNNHFPLSAIIPKNYSFIRGLYLIYITIKVLITKRRIQITQLLDLPNEYGYNFTNEEISKTSAMCIVFLALILLLPIFSYHQMLLVLFKQQGKTLLFGPKHLLKPSYYCKNYDKYSSYEIANTITVIIFTIFIEYVFFSVSKYRETDMGWTTIKICGKECMLSENYLNKVRKYIYHYFYPIDPILKRIFIGLPFGLLSVICALVVEIMSIHTQNKLYCTNSDETINSTMYVSTVPLSAQLPQFILYGMLESITIVAILQYLYYLCSKEFQNSLKGFFFSLFYFFRGWAGIIVSGLNYILVYICERTNQKLCLTYCTDEYPQNPKEYTWSIWGLILIVNIPTLLIFGFLAHYSHWKYKKYLIQNREQEINE